MKLLQSLVSVWFVPLLLAKSGEYALSVTAQPVGYFERGCVYDPRLDENGNKITPRVMKVGPKTETKDGDFVMSAEICSNICKTELPGFAFLGTQFGKECWCDTDFSAPVGYPKCNRVCAGNSPEICGGVNALTVYEIGDAPTTPGPTPELTAEPTSKPPPEPTPNPEPTPEPMEEGYFERGCAVNPRSAKIMSGPFTKVKDDGSNEMSAEICFDICKSKIPDFAYFGTEFGKECFCDTDFSTDVGHTKCNRVCADNSPEICGGPEAITVYELGVAPTPDPTPSPTPAPTPEPTAEPPTGPTSAPTTPPPQGCQDVIIEAEDILRSSLDESQWGGWNVFADPTNASGGEYISWVGLNNVNQNNKNFKDGNPMYYEVDIPFPGTYKFQFMCRQPAELADDENDKANDAWVVFKDATRYGPEEGGSYPNHVNNEGFIKIFGGNRKPFFQEKGRGIAAGSISIPVAEFDVAGPTTMGLSGRSHGFQIDQIILRAICED